MRRLPVVGVLTAALLAVSLVGAGLAAARDSGGKVSRGRASSPVTLDDFDPATFPQAALVDNKWLPMIPGTRLVFQGKANRGRGLKSHRAVATITDLTKVIDGVRSIVVWEQDINHGNLEESEINFNAQDRDGNVWLLGEYPAEYEGGKFKRAPDVWISGVAGARAGVNMRADPHTGTSSYYQGLAPAIEFKDKAKVAKTGGHSCVPLNCFDDVLLIKESNPLEPQEGFQLKYYAPGVGNIQVGAIGGKEKEVLVLTAVEQLDPDEMAQARKASLDLEAHAYDGSKVYRGTSPLELCAADGQCSPAA
jgi:hypothetical protein